METVLSGTKGAVCIAPHKPTVLIGKRVNPGRRKRPVDGALSGHIDIIKNEVLAQVSAGADAVEVDIDVPDVEQIALLPEVIKVVQDTVEVPLCINTPSPEALAAALNVYRGKPLINGVYGEEEGLDHVLSLAAKYGAAVVGLCMDENGIPNEPSRRLDIARKIVERAKTAGIPREDVLIDCLTLAVDLDNDAARATLKTIRLVREELGVNITLDVNDIVHDLPNANALHQAFLTAAIMEGVTAPMVNVSHARQNILAVDVLLGRDEHAMRYIKYYHFRRSGMRGLVDWELVG
jgi:5-methyltetrahydrofolate--homocysteine methyltransferase